MSGSLLEVRGLRTVFDTPQGEIPAVDGISFTVGAGENVPDRIDRRHKIGNGSIGDRAECVAVVECETGIRAADVAEQSQHGSPGITYAAD